MFEVSLESGGSEASGKGNFESLQKLLQGMETISSLRVVDRLSHLVPDFKMELTGQQNCHIEMMRIHHCSCLAAGHAGL